MIALLGLLLGACGSTRATPAPADEAPAVVAVQPPEPLFAEGGLQVERQRWTWGPAGGAAARSGLAWRARVALPGLADVVPSATVAPFDGFLPQDAGPWAAINGGFYEDDTAMGLVVSDGVEQHPLGPRGGSGVFAFGPQGPVVVHRDAWVPGPREAVQSVDRLIDQGQVLVRKLGGNAAARSAVVVGRDALWLVALAADQSLAVQEPGRVVLDDTVGEGLPLAAFAEYLLATTGAVSALNLDGAISTSFAAQAGGQSLRIMGERGTINAVVIRPAPP